jgi:Tol biopolymer transport system component
MQLQPGQKLGHHRLVEQIGEGGMGVVWKAVDTTLDREVAIKVLPAGFTADADRLARFEREARLLASLNHPHIASVFGFHEEDGLRYISLELIAGEDLSDHMQQGPLEPRRAARIALQVAEALETAHENGVVHRDLKPANIKFTQPTSGTTSGSVAATGIESVKVLDFGLAKAMDDSTADASVTQSPTITSAATRDGVILGTAAYMSPEQARGHAADRRSDIWSFGVVLYEMLTGHRPFVGETVSDTLAALLRAEVDFSSLPAAVPPAVRRLLRRCLEKDPRHRLQAIGDARISLENVLAGKDEDEGVAAASATARRPPTALLLAAGLVLGAAITAGIMWTMTPPPQPAPLRKIPLTLTGESGGFSSRPMISPDGTKLIYRQGEYLYLRRLDQWEVQVIPQSEDATPIAWSPDSELFAFFKDETLYKFSLDGGQSAILASIPMDMRSGAWGSAGKIVFTSGPGHLWSVSERGGDPVLIMEPDEETDDDLHEADVLPDGVSLVFISHEKNGDPDRIELLTQGERRLLLQIENADLEEIIYSPSGHLLYERNASNEGIWAVPFSVEKMELTGEPFLVAPGASHPRVSLDGTLVHLSGTSSTSELVMVSRAGEPQQILGQPQDAIRHPSLSPDGTQVAVTGSEEQEWDIWIHDVQRGTKTRLTFEDKYQATPTWSPDGERIAYLDLLDGARVMMKSADGTGNSVPISVGGAPSFSPDGRFVASADRSDGGNLDIFYVELGEDGPGEAQLFLGQAEISEGNPVISPDGRFVAYRSNESGEHEVYIKKFPGGEGKWQVSTNGGRSPVWRHDSSELFYAENANIMAVAVDIVGDSIRLGRPEKLFAWLSSYYTGITGFDVTADGQNFIVVRPVGDSDEVNEILLVQNWLREFAEPAP